MIEPIGKLLSIVILFAEPDFPIVDVSGLVPFDGATVVQTVEELDKALTQGRLLVWRHGSAFPAECGR